MFLCIFGSIVYNRVIVYKRQNFLRVHVIIIDQCGQQKGRKQSGIDTFVQDTKGKERNPGNGYLKPRYSCHGDIRVQCR